MQGTNHDVSNASRPRRLVLAAAVAAGTLLLSCGPRATSDLRACTNPVASDALGESAMRARAAARRAKTERRILELVREHRRATPDAWRRELAGAVHRESVAAGLDPLLVASMVARESSFKSRAVSHAGAVGLMQLRPWVARDVARRGEIAWHGTETLHDPQINVRLGILYYKELLERFDGDAEMALTAYNAGPTRVTRQVRRGDFRGSRYAARVLDLYKTLRLAEASAETQG